MHKLSVLIPCYNSEKVIRSALESVKWADEILICDSYSTDRTLEICRNYTDRIIQHEYINSAKQKNWAIPQCRHDWVLAVDTDEVLEDGLKEEIQYWLKRDSIPYDGFRIRSKNFIYGKWIKHARLYPEYHVRLFQKDRGKFQDREVHAHLIVPGAVGTLTHHLLHNGFKDVSSWVIKIERYTRYECTERLKRRHAFQISKHFLGTPAVFCDRFFLKLGFLDGYRGFLVSALDAFYYFLIGVRLWEAIHSKEKFSS